VSEISYEGVYLHACPQVHLSVIDEHDDEILTCRCYQSRSFLDAQDLQAVVIDLRREGQQ
jgi:hypothetical protein